MLFILLESVVLYCIILIYFFIFQVFKDGRKGTLTQLKKFSHIHFVSVLWVDACKTIGCKVNEGLYPARNPQVEADGVFPAKGKRVKSLQPKTFEEDVNNSASKICALFENAKTVKF